MTIYYSQKSGNATDTTVWNTARDGSGAALASFATLNNNSLTIQAGHNIAWDGDTSSWANGIASVVIEGGATPGMLYSAFSAAGIYWLKIPTATTISGTTDTNRGRLLANSDGIWGHTGSLPLDRRFIIDLQGSAQINASNLDIQLYDTEPTIKYVRTYGTIYKSTDATPFSVDPVTDTFTRAGHGWANGAIVSFESTGNLPAPLQRNTYYWIVNSTANTFQVVQYTGLLPVDVTDVGSGTISVYNAPPINQTLNVLEDVTNDPAWNTPPDSNLLVVSIASPSISTTSIMTSSGKTSSQITFASNINTNTYPGARIYLATRNVAIRSTTTAQITAVDFGTSTFTGCVFQCEIRNTALPATWLGVGVNGGCGHTFSGIATGLKFCLQKGDSWTVPGLVIGYSGIDTHTNISFSGLAIGTYYALSGCTGGAIAGEISGSNTALYNCSGMTFSGRAFASNQGATSSNHMLYTGTFINCGYVFTAYALGLFTGTISGCNVAVNSTGNIIAGVIKGCGTGILNCTAVLRGAILGGAAGDANGIDINGGVVTGYGAGCFSTTQVTNYRTPANATAGDDQRILLYDVPSDPGIASPGRIQSWTYGGKIASIEWADVPADVQADYPGETPLYLHKLNYELAAFPNWFEWPFTAKAGVPVTVTAYVQSAQMGMAASPSLKICIPNRPLEDPAGVLAVATAADNADWQTLIATYTPSSDQQLMIRMSGKNASGSTYFYMVFPGTSNLSLGSDERNAIADAVLLRSVANVEADAPVNSLCYVALALANSSTVAHPGKLTVFRTDGTEFTQRTITSQPGAAPITEVKP